MHTTVLSTCTNKATGLSSTTDATLKYFVQVLQTGDVIAFYNSVFVPAVKTDLLRINQDRASLPAPPAPEGLIGESPVRRYNRLASILILVPHILGH